MMMTITMKMVITLVFTYTHNVTVNYSPCQIEGIGFTRGWRRAEGPPGDTSQGGDTRMK